MDNIDILPVLPFVLLHILIIGALVSCAEAGWLVRRWQRGFKSIFVFAAVSNISGYVLSLILFIGISKVIGFAFAYNADNSFQEAILQVYILVLAASLTLLISIFFSKRIFLRVFSIQPAGRSPWVFAVIATPLVWAASLFFLQVSFVFIFNSFNN